MQILLFVSVKFVVKSLEKSDFFKIYFKMSLKHHCSKNTSSISNLVSTLY